MLTYEEEARAQGYTLVCGVDEAGAGPVAGPVVAAAVILPASGTTLQAEGLTDSKKLSEKRREALFPLIQAQAVAYGIGVVSAQEIDQTDILSARLKAMSLAMAQLQPQGDFALIDGNRDKGKTWEITQPHRLLVKGDSLSLSIAAASVLAKVQRDRWMVELGEQYPQYGFEKHKGYGTKVHLEQIRQHKLCPEHRRSFLKKKWEALELG